MVELLKTKNKDKIVKVAGEKEQITHGGKYGRQETV